MGKIADIFLGKKKFGLRWWDIEKIERDIRYTVETWQDPFHLLFRQSYTHEDIQKLDLIVNVIIQMDDGIQKQCDLIDGIMCHYGLLMASIICNGTDQSLKDHLKLVLLKAIEFFERSRGSKPNIRDRLITRHIW